MTPQEALKRWDEQPSTIVRVVETNYHFSSLSNNVQYLARFLILLYTQGGKPAAHPTRRDRYEPLLGKKHRHRWIDDSRRV